MNTRTFALLLCTLPYFAGAAVSTVQAQQCGTCPDTVFYNGHILTGAHLRPEDSSATPAYVTAIAVRAGRIIDVGTDARILADVVAQTRKVDLQGAFVMPGFNDAHTHMAAAGQQKLSVDLDNVASLAAMQAKIRAYVATLAPGQWVLGGGWDHTKWATKKLPTRQDLDAVTGDHPAYMERTDGHIAVVNTAALRAAHITAATKAPAGSQIDVEAGSLTGIVREGPALALIQQVIPKPTPEMRRRALQVAIDDALSHGVTSVQDFSDYEDFLALEAMEQEGSLHLRFSEWLAFETPIGVLDSRRAEHSADDNLLHLGMLKAFMDGSLGSRTALMSEPYSDAPDNSGLPRFQQEKLNEMSSARAADGFQLGFHAIGDLANDMALDAFAAAEQVARPANALPPVANPDASVVSSVAATPAPRDLRFRIEHAQVVSPGAFQRFHDLGVIASMQPSHLLTDMAWAGQRLGPERVKYAYAWRSLLDHGVTLAFGTDYPVESVNPFRGLYSAVTRKNEAGTQTFQPQERLTIQQALYAYTQASAFAEFRETVKGRLQPGYLADMVVLDRDITKATPQELLHTRVLRTIVDGQTVYTAK